MSPEPLAVARLRRVAPSTSTDFPYEAMCELLVQRSDRLVVQAALGVSDTALLDAIVELGTWVGVTCGAAPTVKLPSGFTRGACGRDLRRAMSNLLHHQPTPPMLATFRAQRRDTRAVTHGIEVAAALVTLAATGGIERLDEIARRPDGSFDPALAAALVHAYDVLESGRRRARAAVLELLEMMHDPRPHRAMALFRSLTWLHEAEARRGLAAAARGSEALGRYLSGFLRLVHANQAAWLPASIAGLRYGQVLRLWQHTEPCDPAPAVTPTPSVVGEAPVLRAVA